jgi:hypothetical protein
MRKNQSPTSTWTTTAVKSEDRKLPDRLWPDEPSIGDTEHNQIQRIKFLRIHAKTEPALNQIANCIEACFPKSRCLSGACVQCGRLLQRQYVRHARRLIKNAFSKKGNLISISAVPTSQIVRPGELNSFSTATFQRHIKEALKFAGIKSAIGAIDYSFNEDKENEWPPFICPHVYLITSADSKARIKKLLSQRFKKLDAVSRPVFMRAFHPSNYCISYSYKTTFDRRISYYKDNVRDTSYSTLLVHQRIELFRHLHANSLGARIIFLGVRPEKIGNKVKFRLNTPPNG